ncbi:hypothetical protein [Rhizomonospora bruguierae]|uniref:hypothetical protein n=1 Tax=Rhizomonospora bruguierae TaxID=1581705 RepID=UPI001BCB38A6|nr:hypothetical protein [Micromonospora sp. NBRC 107566]
MPPEPHRPRELEYQIFLGSEVVQRGLLTGHQLRSQAWRRIRQNVYADARLAPDHPLACRAVALRAVSGLVIAGPSAASLLGIEHAAAFSDDVHVLAPPDVRVSAQRGLRVHATAYDHDDLVETGALPHTTVERTAWDVAGWLPPLRAVPILDAMLNRGLLAAKDLPAILDRWHRRRGYRKGHLVFGLLDGSAGGPAESWVRARLRLAGVPRPVLRYPLRLGEAQGAPLTLDVDMAWPERRVAVEYTANRLTMLRVAGWLAIHAPLARVGRHFPRVLKEVRQALHRRGWRPEERV